MPYDKILIEGRPATDEQVARYLTDVPAPDSQWDALAQTSRTPEKCTAAVTHVGSHTPSRCPSQLFANSPTQEISPKRIIVSHINICSMRNNVQDIRSIISRHGIDILAVSETCL